MSKIRIPYSEEEMGNVFHKLLLSKSGLTGIGRFDATIREYPYAGFCPDFVSARFIMPRFPAGTNIALCHRIIDILALDSWVTGDYIMEKIPYPGKEIYRTIKILVTNAYIEEISNGKYIIGKKARYNLTQVWAFELKLKELKKAIIQASRNREFADKSVIVMPENPSHFYMWAISKIEDIGIGLCTFDKNNNKFKIIVKPKYNPQLIKIHCRMGVINSLVY